MDLLAEHVITPDSDIPTKYVNLSKYFGVSQKFIDKYKNTASFHIIAYQEDKLFWKKDTATNIENDPSYIENSPSVSKS